MAVNLNPYTKKYLEKQGFTVEKTENYNYFTKRRSDLLGVGDFLALNGEDLLLVQVTDHTSGDKHKKKIEKSDKLKLWISAGGSFVMHLWKKRNNRWLIAEHTYEDIIKRNRKTYNLP